MEGRSTVGKYSSSIFSVKTKQRFKRWSVMGPVLFNVFTGNLEKGEVRKLTMNTKLFRVGRTSTNHEELQKNHM